MVQFLFNVILYPLILIIEFVYIMVLKVFKAMPQPEGLAIIGVSVAITLLCLPLYIVAENWQEIERDTQKRLEPGINRIKAVFKGDEQYMILRTFYKQNGYHPLMALRSSFGLLIQIPFFMAAYTYLSHLESLKGVSFLFIKDLGVPDATFHIGNFGVNVLPIAMTLINCVSGAIYTKGFKIKDKLQVYGMAAIFLVILYQSPAGLVLYWTMNNVFSMIKNIFYKMRKPLLVFYICACIGVTVINWYLLFKHKGAFNERFSLVLLLTVVYFIPLILKLIRYTLNTILKPLVYGKKLCFCLFLSSSLVLVSVLGLYIVTTLVTASPVEFSFVDSIDKPFEFIRINLYKALGLCFVWPLCIYFLFGKNIKACVSSLFSVIALVVLVNVFIFPGDYGNLKPIMIFDNPDKLYASTKAGLLNILLGLFMFVLVFVLFAFKKTKWVTGTLSFVCVALCSISFISFGKISKEYKNLVQMKSSVQKSGTVKPVFHLSKTEKNIFVIDLDRACGAFIPQIFKDKPELLELYSGFVYYPNTFSFGLNTLVGSPAMFGGYEYTPTKMMTRDTESLVAKHNEALKVMPTIMSENGFDVTVADMSFANYSFVADMRIYNDMENVNALSLVGTYKDAWLSDHPEIAGKNYTSDLMKINIFWYSILRCSPLVIREMIYNDGLYWSASSDTDDIFSFIKYYSVLDYMPKLTDFTSDNSTYSFLVNDTTHEPIFLQAPDYIPSKDISDLGPDLYANEKHYHAIMASFLRLGEWIQKLKDNGVYDNTRIILVSDHGAPIQSNIIPEPTDGVTNERIENVNPILLVKDFGSNGSLVVDNTYMCNGDTPAITLKGIVENPVNPFTKTPIDMSGKNGGLYGCILNGWSPQEQNRNTFSIKSWFKTGTNVFDKDAVYKVTESEAMEAAK